MAALEAVNGLLAKLADDEDLHEDLRQPQVQVAMRHWTAQERLPPEQAEKLMGDYRVMAVLTKIKALQTECQRAGIPVPLDAVLRRERALNLPGGGGGQAPPPQAKKPAAPKKKTTTAGKEEEGKGQKAGQAKAAATVAADDAPASGPVAAAPSVSATAAAAVAPRGSKRRPPQTLFEWLHLLSPLLTLVFGILYALTRAVGTGSGRKSGP